jgi:hypothetical protein
MIAAAFQPADDQAAPPAAAFEPAAGAVAGPAVLGAAAAGEESPSRSSMEINPSIHDSSQRLPRGWPYTVDGTASGADGGPATQAHSLSPTPNPRRRSCRWAWEPCA